MPPEGVETVQGRLETFQIAHIVKRRGSTAKKRVPATLKWPSKLPTPEDVSPGTGFNCAMHCSNKDLAFASRFLFPSQLIEPRQCQMFQL